MAGLVGGVFGAKRAWTIFLACSLIYFCGIICAFGTEDMEIFLPIVIFSFIHIPIIGIGGFLGGWLSFLFRK